VNPDLPLRNANTPYALELETHLDAVLLARLTCIYEDIGASFWLAVRPLSRLELTREVWDEGVQVAGLYSYPARWMKVATRRVKTEYGKPWVWQGVYSVSSTATTQTQAVQMTLVHELGHHVHSVLGVLDEALFLKTMRANILQGGTTYSRSRRTEYFAECFALYTFYSTELLLGDPEGYGMIELALERVGLEVKQHDPR